jgi:hypothetical protein
MCGKNWQTAAELPGSHVCPLVNTTSSCRPSGEPGTTAELSSAARGTTAWISLLVARLLRCAPPSADRILTTESSDLHGKVHSKLKLLSVIVGVFRSLRSVLPAWMLSSSGEALMVYTFPLSDRVRSWLRLTRPLGIGLTQLVIRLTILSFSAVFVGGFVRPFFNSRCGPLAVVEIANGFVL